jgi:hypothetical protein
MPSTLWPLAGVWICVDMVKLVQNRYDRALHDRLAPVLEGCVLFLLDFLVPSEDGKYLVTNPSVSPENTFITASGKPGILCEGSTMDMSIVGEAFRQFLWSTKQLGIDNSLSHQVKDALGKLPPIQVNKAGLIQEWGLRDYGELEPGHRHVSHLYGLFPGDTIRSEELRLAAKNVLDRRAAHGGGHTGWSRAWLLNLHARLGDAERCGRHMDLLLSQSTLPNLLDTHPPFQIDGNFGGCAGVIECLIQWQDTADGLNVQLLPACPMAWAAGSLKDVCVKGHWFVSFEWFDNKVIDPVTVEYDGGETVVTTVSFPSGMTATFKGQGRHHVRQSGV